MRQRKEKESEEGGREGGEDVEYQLSLGKVSIAFFFKSQVQSEKALEWSVNLKTAEAH